MDEYADVSKGTGHLRLAAENVTVDEGGATGLFAYVHSTSQK